MKKNCNPGKAMLLIPKFILLFFLSLSLNAYSQDNPIWSDKTETDFMKAADRQIVPVAYRTISADLSALKSLLAKAPMQSDNVNAKTSSIILLLPLPDGSMQRFSIVESPVMAPELAAKYPEIKTFLGQGVDDPSASVRCDMTPKGFHAMIYTTDGIIFIDPYRKGDIQNYISYYKKDFIPPPNKYMPEYNPQDKFISKDISQPPAELASGTQLRTYRLALAADSNYYNFQGGTKPLTLAAMVTSMNRVNFVYEREVGIRMIIIANNDQIIFTGSTSPYPYTVTDACGLRPQNQTKIDAVIGSANYDIGHLFAMSSGGCATGNSICNAATKAYGVTGTGNPVGDPFDIDYVAHEIGHQFNGSHTWNGTLGSCSPGQYVASSAYEPGSGTTIMAYAGICDGDDLQPNSNAYFHTRSFDQIVAYSTTGTGNGCPVTTSTGNAVPTVNAGANFTIPISTPFILTGSGSDSDGDPLTFCWEEFDLGPAGPPNVSTTTGPIFRSFNPVTGTSRTFPKLSDILNNTTTIGEILPSITRTMTFRLTARDNRAGGGGVNYSSMTLNVTATAGPFAVTSPNAATTWCPGPQTVTWSVNGSNTLAANVNILLSTDGGNTFPITLVSNTANDGSQSVTIPCTFSTSARIKVEAVGNVFFDISNANFTVGDNTKPTFTVPASIIINKDASCNYNASTAITGDVTDEADNCDNTLNATFVDGTAPGSCVGETIITRTWTLTDDCSNSTVKVQTISIRDNTAPTFTDPADIVIYKDADCNYDASTAITGDVTDEADNCDNTLNATFADVATPGSCDGETILTRTWTLTDDCNNSTVKVQTITIKDITPPTFTDPADITIYKDNSCNHDASVGVTGDVTDEADNCDNTLDATFSDVTVAGSCIGEEIITRTWSLTDDCGNNTMKTQTILVKDTTRPNISNISANPSVLWPPNHKMRDVTINYTAVDNCSPVTNVLSVTSNEPINGTGDGDTAPDWVVIDDHHVKLRAERAGNGNGRIYTIKITSTDDCGNVAIAYTTVLVPHNMNMVRGTSGETEINDKPDIGLSVRIMPNPTSDNFTVIVNSENDADKIIMNVYDATGKKIEDRLVANGKAVSFGNSYIPGVYFINVMQGSKSRNYKIIKTN